MGCCFSRKEGSSKGKPATDIRRSSGREPPPEPDAPQEETVKEVLSETPRPRARVGEEAKEEEIRFDKKEAGLGVINGCEERSEEASEAGSLSENFSISTTVTEKREEEGDAEEEVVGRRRKEGSPAKFQRKRTNSGEFQAAKERGVGVGCRSRRTSPSPVRRTEGPIGRTYSSREAGHPTRSRVAATNGLRREPGERSGRRSVSPAMKRAAEQRVAGGQCRSLSSSRVNGRSSPCRIPARAPSDGVAKRGQEQDTNTATGGSSEGKESLENPLVSLECFIFL